MNGRVAGMLVLAAASLTLVGCTSATPKPHLAALTADLGANHIVPLANGRGSATLATATIPAGARLDVQASCIGHGTVTVNLPGGLGGFTVYCQDISGTQRGSVDYPKVPATHGPVTLTASSDSIVWNVLADETD